jgi:hypothetical protein
LLPQIACVLAVVLDPRWRFTALAAGFGYAALIFSFLGGVWWGIGVARDRAPPWIYGLAVVPSLIAFGAYLPWVFGAAFPGPSLILLGLCLIASPLVDRALARGVDLPAGWLALRWQLSVGLGLLTLLLALI